ncbi:hypothetical protein BC829DRAFT_112456 [Chytridium lagenaria]|nr:hypothetical protein BC829DRAFT_112456 [Chytridium lagenaria]
MSSSSNPFTSIPRRSTPPPSIRRVTPPPSPTLPSTAKQVSEQILTDPVTTLQHLGVDDASNAAPGKLPAFAIPAGLAVTDGIGEGDGNGTVGSVGGQTLSLLLKPVVEEITEEAQQEYAAFHSVAKWMMGSTQSTLPYYAMYPPIMRSYQISLPALSDIPRTDLGRGPISI